MNFSLIFKVVISLPKTIMFNFIVFPFTRAIRFPVLVSYNVKLAHIYRNCIIIDSPLSFFMIKVNISNGSEAVDIGNRKNGYLKIGDKGRIIFHGKANFSAGISLESYGNLIFGSNFFANKNCFISCNRQIKIGNDVLFGWDVHIRDSDGHLIYKKEETKVDKEKVFGDVVIGNHVWFGANIDVLKNVSIPNNCVIGYNSCVTKRFTESDCLIGGYPAKVLKENITWEK